MSTKYLSGCPISFALDLIGDKWSLLVLRDIMLWDKKHYDEFAASDEGISTNILAARLKQLEADGLISRMQDEDNRRRYIYQPTEKAVLREHAQNDGRGGSLIDELDAYHQSGAPDVFDLVRKTTTDRVQS